ncbi:MAG: NAD+ synthase, partial [FCB group bacterium]|nr:NAD+ synthase [FCB group bacterium]
ITKTAKASVVILGTVRHEGKKIYNSAAVLQNGKLLGFRDKSLLPTYDVFDEDRYFEPAESVKPLSVTIGSKTVNLGIEICEDLWDADYDLKVSRELVNQDADLLINISASPFSINKQRERLRLVKDKVDELKKHFIYCNLVGAQDELVFDGGSFVYSVDGFTVAVCDQFNTQLKLVDLDNCTKVEIVNLPEEEQIFNALALGVKDYFGKTGHQKAVLGLSGGIDSALTAVIAENALGPDNVLGITMPSQFSSDHSIEDSRVLAQNLGIRFENIPIKSVNREFLSALEPVFRGTEEGLAEENLQARIRGNILMATANKLNALLLNTGNKTETALGYCTMYGDMCGALAVISDLNKTQVYAVSRWINKQAGKPVIPVNTIEKPPSAELKPDQVDPFDYDMISPLVDAIVTENRHLNSLVAEGYDREVVADLLKKIQINEYKRRQAAPGIRISMKAFGIGRRYPIVNRFSND